MKREITETTTTIGTAMLLIKLIFLFPLFLVAQTDTTTTLTFDFNEHEIKENNNKVKIKPVNVSMVADRFGNENSAVYVQGHNSSYLNLGTSDFYKTNNISISLWANLDVWMRTGKGYKYNPILIIKNGPGTDWINAISICYDAGSDRLGFNSTRDSTNELNIADKANMRFSKWYHLVVVCNNKFMAFYVDGVLQGKLKKTFETKFLATDSLVIGHSANTKNERFMRGMIDDIKIFHRALGDQEVKELYNAPNPNKFKNILVECLKYGGVLLLVICVIIILIIRNRKELARQKERLEFINKMSQMELKAVKAQMNPHFVSNCLVAIQNLVLTTKIDKAIDYIAKFNFFLRQILKYSDENYIPLGEEVQMIKLYVELEQLRFESGFNFELQQDPAIDYTEVMIPSLITQPFIENAIWHGLLRLDNLRDAKLIIRIIKKGETVTIEIEDNGIGRDLSKEEITGKGTQLAFDKIESLNRLAGNNHYKIEIVDKFDSLKKSTGTKVIIYLEI